MTFSYTQKGSYTTKTKTNMSSSSNLHHQQDNEDSSSGSNRRLSQDEMRARRLRALGQAVAPGLLAGTAIPREEMHALLLGNQNRSNNEKPPAKKKAKNDNSKVIELLDSSDSEEDDGKLSPQRRGRPANQKQIKDTIEILDASSDDDDDDSDNDRKLKKKEAAAAKKQKSIENPYSRKRKAAPAASRATTDSDLSNTFQVATWNVWFGPLGDGNPHPGPRMRALCRILHEQHSGASPLLFVGFQEVVDPLATYLKAAMEGGGYTWFRQTGAPYGCALAVHNSLTMLDQVGARTMTLS